MAKELPYFQFEPANYLTGSIQFCSLSAQGLFINLLSIYWQRECDLSIEQVKKRFNSEELLQELITENILKVKDGKITIQFLKDQYNNVVEVSKIRSQSGKAGNKKRWDENRKPIANASQTDPKSIAIREDKIREDDIRGNKRIVFKQPQIFELLSTSPDATSQLAESFLDYYNSNGWMVGRNKMKDWKASFRNWIRNEKKFQKTEPKKGGVFVP